MSVTLNNVLFFGAADMPEADNVTVGGAVDFTKKIAFADISPAGTVDVVSSSSSDTATKIQIMGRDSTGVVQTPASITLTGTTLISNAFSSQSFERLLAGVLTGGAVAGLANPGGTAAQGDVAVLAHTRTISGHTAQTGSANTSGTTPPLFHLQSGDGATLGALTYAGLGLILRITGGTGSGQLRQVAAGYSSGAYGTDLIAVNRDWSTIPDATSTYDIAQGFLFDVLPSGISGESPVVAITRLFATAAADVAGGATRIFYEKVFAVNLNAATSLTGAQIEVLSETPSLPGSAALDLGLTAVLDDSATIANRQTAPAGIGFTTQPAFIDVPSPGNLPGGSAPNSAGAQACWLRLTLPPGTAAYKGAADLRVQGSTT